MASIEELEARVAALEDRLGMEAGLRASADRDLADLAGTVRAQTFVVQAMAATQIEHGSLLRDHTVRLERINTNLHTLATGQERITDMLQTLIDREAGE